MQPLIAAVPSRARQRGAPPLSGTASLRLWCIAAVLVAATGAVYLPILGQGFVNFDDPDYVLANAAVRQGLSVAGLRWALTSFHAANWHPLSWLSHMADVSLFGLLPSGHHASSLVLHAATAVVLLLVLRALTGALWRPALVASLFALHPLQVESVAWVAERKNVLSTFLLLLTVALYRRHAGRPRRTTLFALTGLYGLGLAAKPMLVTLPLLLLLLDWWPLGRLGTRARSLGALVTEKLPLFGLAGVSCLLTLHAQSRAGAVAAQEIFPPWSRIANAAASYAAYLGQALWPHGLSPHYPHPGTAVSLDAALAGALLLVSVSALVARWRLRAPHAAVGWLWYLVALVPVAGLVQVGDQAHADRYAYLTLIGPWVALSWGCGLLAAGRPRRTVALAAAWVLALGALGLAAHAQTRYWRDGVTLFTHALDVAPPSAKAHLNLGVALTEQGRDAEALPHFAEARRLRPQDMLPPYNAGRVLARQGNFDAALAAYREAVRLGPGFAAAHGNLGLLLEERGASREALESLRRAVALDPASAEARSNLANALARRGEAAEACVLLEEALRLDPRNASVRYNLANALAGLQRYAEAEAHYRASLELAPGAAQSRNNLGVVLVLQGRPAEARVQFEAAVRIDPAWAEARENLRRLATQPGR